MANESIAAAQALVRQAEDKGEEGKSVMHSFMQYLQLLLVSDSYSAIMIPEVGYYVFIMAIASLVGS